MSETSAELGGALNVALLGSLGTLIYRVQMQAVDVAGLAPAQAAKAGHEENPAGAEIVDQRPRPVGFQWADPLPTGPVLQLDWRADDATCPYP
jgi:DHA2 family multidrug resistance protein-like MFS transporter